jgi:hypothetical protein
LAILNRPEQFGAGIARWGEGLRPTVAALIRFLIETAASTGMASNVSGLLNREQQNVGIAVVAKTPQGLGMAAGGTLVPKLLAGSAPVMHFTGLKGVFDRVLIHPRHHQYRSIEPILSNGWN